MKSYIVVDLGFGDSGKGTTIDALSSQMNPDLVVRFNGGGQAGHNVVTSDGRHHCFNLFGAGTLSSGCSTYLGGEVVVHPLILWNEALRLKALGITEPFGRMIVNPNCRVTTHYQVAVNRLRELRRFQRNGSCGIGFGETVEDSIYLNEEGRGDEQLRFHDLLDLPTLEEKLRLNKQHCQKKLEVLAMDRWNYDWEISAPEILASEDLLNSEEELKATIDLYHRTALYCGIKDDQTVEDSLKLGVLFEGAQGVLLDQDWGFHPYTTWSNCTFENAIEILNNCGHQDYEKIGVIRSYQTRHGRGPLPSYSERLTDAVAETHNPFNPWQEEFRCGHLDLILLDYAVKTVEGIDQLAVTHMDQFNRSSEILVVSHYHYGDLLDFRKGDRLAQSRVSSFRIAFPQTVPRFDFLPLVSKAANAPIGITSFGPKAGDKLFSEELEKQWSGQKVCSLPSI